MYSVTGPSMEELQFHIAGLNELVSENNFVLFGPGIEEWLNTRSMSQDVFLVSTVMQKDSSLDIDDVIAEWVRGRFWKQSGGDILKLFTENFRTYILRNIEGYKVSFVYMQKSSKGEGCTFGSIQKALSQEPFACSSVFLQSGSINTIHESIPGGIEACRLKQIVLNPAYSSIKRLAEIFDTGAIDYLHKIAANQNYFLAKGWTWKHPAHKKTLDKMIASANKKKVTCTNEQIPAKNASLLSWALSSVEKEKEKALIPKKVVNYRPPEKPYKATTSQKVIKEDFFMDLPYPAPFPYPEPEAHKSPYGNLPDHTKAWVEEFSAEQKVTTWEVIKPHLDAKKLHAYIQNPEVQKDTIIPKQGKYNNEEEHSGSKWK